MAHQRDFEIPSASFDIDSTKWQSTSSFLSPISFIISNSAKSLINSPESCSPMNKTTLHSTWWLGTESSFDTYVCCCRADYFSYAPYKYEVSRFVSVACGMKEQLDPTVYTVLTAKSKIPGVSLSEFAVFTPKWLNTQNTFRPPVY